MVAALDIADGLVKRFSGTIDNDKELIFPRLPNDRLRLQLGEVDMSLGEDLQYFD